MEIKTSTKELEQHKTALQGLLTDKWYEANNLYVELEEKKKRPENDPYYKLKIREHAALLWSIRLIEKELEERKTK